MTASSPSHQGSVAQRASSADRIWTLRLLGMRNAKLDLAVSACLVAALAWSRFAFLPSGPWEWDETLLARGILKFDLHAHFPHPPGFPLWLALGWLAQHVVSEPLRGLQLLSALSSVLSLWPLAAIARRAAPAYLATTTALVFLMLPGVWLYANRAFADTPATFFALLAAAIACKGLGSGLGGREATAFTLAVTASFLIRPILLPPLFALWAAGALAVHERRKLLPGYTFFWPPRAWKDGDAAALALGLDLGSGYAERTIGKYYGRHAFD